MIVRGETISHVGDVRPENQQAQVPNKVGFKWSYWGVLWIDLFTHDGTYCVYDGRRYVAIDPAEAARLLGKGENELSKPFLYRVPLGWLILIPIIVIFIIAAVLDKKRTDEVRPLFQDPTYQKALAIVSDEYSKQEMSGRIALGAEAQAPTDDASRFRLAFEAGVNYLIGAGIPREQAERHLKTMVQTLAHSEQRKEG